jgi:phosphoribosylanthranilate isomerase
MPVKVKICGIKNLDIALTSIALGAEFLGFNFVHTSKNYIRPDKAKEIIDQLRGKAQTVGLFQNEILERVKQITSELNLDFIQLHGQEDQNYCSQIGKPIIKAFMLPADFDLKQVRDYMNKYQVDYFLVDREKRGEGEILNSSKTKELAQNYPLFLAGGLTPENVGQVLQTVRPFAVDVSSGVETEGVKDIDKIKQFIGAVRRSDHG